jgi:arabinofuranosyltransferase
LLLSRSFRSYVISGLENPLSFALLAWIAVELIREQRVRYYRLAFAVSLCVITRLDNAVLIAPVIAAVTWHERRSLRFGRLALAISPAIVWYAFSLFYYGFFVPNTKYAKLQMGLPWGELVRQGTVYCLNFVKSDLLGCLWTCGAIGIALSRLPHAWRVRFDASHRDTRLFLLGLGFLMHVAYVLYVGGDFMPGRFFSNLVVMAIAIVAATCPFDGVQSTAALAAAMTLVAGLDHFVIQARLPDRTKQELNGGIDDQHDYYWNWNGIRSDPGHFLRREPSSPWIEEGRRFAAEAGDDFKVFRTACSGMKFYYGGPHIVVADIVGLGDPLFARLPIRNPKLWGWRIGHPLRNTPAGYLEARQTGNLSKMDPTLAKYYAKLRLVTAGNLFSRERMIAIVGFQLGWYEPWLEDYAARAAR